MKKKRTSFDSRIKEKIAKTDSEKSFSEPEKSLNFIKLTPNIRFLHFKKDVEKDYSVAGEKNKDLIYFGVILGESFVHKHGNTLENHHPSKKYDLFLHKNTSSHQMEFTPAKSYEFLTFSISIDSFEDLVKPNKFKEYLAVFNSEKLIYNNRANLKILNLALEISAKSQEGIQIIGKLYLLMDLILEQYLQEQCNSSISEGFDFKEWEVDALLQISREIKKNPERDFSVGGISAETGVSIPRLQAGFKEMHEKTVALYIKDMRLKQAEKLIRTTNYNISEVVYKVGLTSRSYFSRIFKEKYRLTPSEYKKNFYK